MILNDGIIKTVYPSIRPYIGEVSAPVTAQRWVRGCNYIRRSLGYQEMSLSGLVRKSNKENTYNSIQNIRCTVMHTKMLKDILFFVIQEEMWTGFEYLEDKDKLEIGITNGFQHTLDSLKTLIHSITSCSINDYPFSDNYLNAVHRIAMRDHGGKDSALIEKTINALRDFRVSIIASRRRILFDFLDSVE